MSTRDCRYRFTPNPATCETDTDGITPPSDDERCLDPVFAEANPDICAGFPILILKPETAIAESGGTVLYKTFIRSGGNENELLLGLTYGAANLDVALIGPDGLATGVAAGITTISVLWQNLSAFAQLQVVADCGQLATNFVIVIDNSKSMGQPFSSSYANKLTFSKEMAILFINLVNFSKDKVAVYSFKDSASQIIALNSSMADSLAAVITITGGEGKTNLYNALKTATDYLADKSGVKAILLFSDGEDNGDLDSLPVSKAFKEAGGIIAGIAVRAWGPGFELMFKSASAGYFLSAHSATQTLVASILPNLKSYMCSGDCVPEPGTFPTAQLNYNGFINWDVEGYVDLVGLGHWDIRPGNGLYVDMAGTADAGQPPAPGAPNVGPFGLSKLTSKTTFDFVAGNEYHFSIKACGYAGTNTANALKITIGPHTYSFATPVSMSFTTYEFTFTPVSDFSAQVVIEQTSRNAQNQGTLIDDVLLENADTAETMLFDDFNEENPTTIETTYSYYGCIDTPPGAQTADPTPPTPSVQE